MYARNPLNDREQHELDNDLKALGIEAQPEDGIEEVLFWEEHHSAIEWWCQVAELMRWQGRICEGLDIVAVKADAEMAERKYSKDDYLRLRLIANTVTHIFNEQLNDE